MRLLACGIAAGPVFVAVWAIQAFTRAGFDPGRHPLSLLSLGELGWIQIANFVVSGALLVACGLGLRRAGAGLWGPLLVGLNGVGLIIAGVFPTDAGAGFPPGAPAGAPERISWHGVLHEVGFVVAMVSWLAACAVFGRYFARLRERGRLATCAAAPLAVLAVDGWPDLDTLSVRLVIGSAISFALVAALAVRFMRR